MVRQVAPRVRAPPEAGGTGARPAGPPRRPRRWSGPRPEEAARATSAGGGPRGGEGKLAVSLTFSPHQA